MLQVKYAMREYACRAIDVIARRTRLSFINVHAAQEALPRVIEMMAEELNWDEKRKEVRGEKLQPLVYIVEVGGGGGGVKLSFSVPSLS